MLSHGDLTTTYGICRYREASKTKSEKKSHKIYDGIESFHSHGTGKLKLCLFQIFYNNYIDGCYNNYREVQGYISIFDTHCVSNNDTIVTILTMSYDTI